MNHLARRRRAVRRELPERTRRRIVAPSQSRHRHPRRARTQPQEHLARDPARPDGRDHRPERLGQIDARFRSSLRGRAAPFSRQHVALRAAVRRATGKARCRLDRRPSADASRSSSGSRAAAANRPSPRSPKFIIFSGCFLPRPARNFARTAICRWKNRASPRSLGKWKRPRDAVRSRCSRRWSRRAKDFTPKSRAGRSDRVSIRSMSIGQLIPVAQFRKLERFKEHTIDAVVGMIDAKRILKARNLVQRALEIGRGTAHLLDAKNRLTVMSTEMSCPGCGRAFEELDPRLVLLQLAAWLVRGVQRLRRNLERKVAAQRRRDRRVDARERAQCRAPI